MHRIRPEIIALLSVVAAALFVWRAVLAVAGLMNGDEVGFLSFPLAVILPSLVFGYFATLRDMISAEGALMQFGAMIQLLLILAMPQWALHLALGFPVVFLCVELFETRLPGTLRDRLKRGVLA